MGRYRAVHFQKRLEGGSFASLWRDNATSVRLTMNELALFIEGCTLVGRHALSPSEIVPRPLATDPAM